GHGRPCHTNDRGGTAATDYTQGRLKMQPSGHTRFYTTLTDATLDGIEPLLLARLECGPWIVEPNADRMQFP
ncbi:hypothetical protein NZL82_09955, partial [Sphingomonas sanguinis]|uniref:hypothetical protein n=1 Tax=Sphingomonas sp. LC-1 TaxID=3110957 RepID=UPI0021BA5779